MVNDTKEGTLAEEEKSQPLFVINKNLEVKKNETMLEIIICFPQ